MSEDDSPQWLLLWDAELYLRRTRGEYFALRVPERLKEAVLNRIPVKGCLDGSESIPQRFEHLMQADAKIDILINEVRLPRGGDTAPGWMIAVPRPDQRWRYVEIDRLELDRFLAESYAGSPPEASPRNGKSQDDAAPISPKRRAGAKPTKRQAIAAFISKQFPDGIPAHVKLDSILSDFKRETGGSVSNRTLRRVLGRK